MQGTKITVVNGNRGLTPEMLQSTCESMAVESLECYQVLSDPPEPILYGDVNPVLEVFEKARKLMPVLEVFEKARKLMVNAMCERCISLMNRDAELHDVPLTAIAFDTQECYGVGYGDLDNPDIER